MPLNEDCEQGVQLHFANTDVTCVDGAAPSSARYADVCLVRFHEERGEEIQVLIFQLKAWVLSELALLHGETERF